jgi:hypothetical protein
MTAPGQNRKPATSQSSFRSVSESGHLLVRTPMTQMRREQTFRAAEPVD